MINIPRTGSGNAKPSPEPMTRHFNKIYIKFFSLDNPLESIVCITTPILLRPLCLTHCGLVISYTILWILVITGSSYGLLPKGTKPSPEPMTRHFNKIYIKFFSLDNPPESIVCITTPILLRPRCVNSLWPSDAIYGIVDLAGFLPAKFCNRIFWFKVYQRDIKFTLIHIQIVLKFRNVQDFQNFNQTMPWNLGK